MIDIIGYLAPVIVFLSAIVGLLGPSRRADATGFAAITVFGWISLSIATVSMAGAIYTVHVRQQQFAEARGAQMRLRDLARAEILEGLAGIERVLRFAALARSITMPGYSFEAQGQDAPAVGANAALSAPAMIDLRAAGTVAALESLYLGPKSRLNAPYAGQIPFGSDLSRSAFEIISEETEAAIVKMERALAMYPEIEVDWFEATGAVRRAPFVKHMRSIRERWENRSRLEDSASPISLGFRFIDDSGDGSRNAYFELLDTMDRLRRMLTTDV